MLYNLVYMSVCVTQSYLTLCDPVDCSHFVQKYNMLVSNCVLHQVPGLQTVSPWELLVQFVAISHFILPLLIMLCYFPSFHIRETFCSLSLETKKRIWKVWIKNYIWKTILKYVLSTYFKNEIYLQFISSHKNIACSHVQFHLLLTTTCELSCPWIFPL